MSPVTRSRWVTFDCYGTLVDWQAGFFTVLSRLVGDKAVDLIRAYHDAERTVERDQPHRPYKDVLVTALLRAAERVGVRLSESQARGLQQSWSAMRPFADVESLLAELRARGYRLAVLTNCDDDLFEVTHRTFRQPFDLFLTAERVRGYKPAPWHFRAFELVTGAQRGDWVHVASSWYHDIAPAEAFGVPRVWLDRAGAKGPRRTAATFRDDHVRVGAAHEVVAAIDAIVHQAA